MPEKDGDEGKSTKSVVNKRQKQMMGEEGYDIARDMGRVRPSKDKKDATTMPPSKEMKKTQKVNKGPSAFERVKAKYGKSVMDVGKKKANEELDLTQVADALGGYIVEAPLTSLTGDPEEIASRIKKGAAKATRERQKKAEKNLAKDAGIKLVTQSPEKAAATQAAKDIGVDNLTPDVRRGMRSTAADRGLDEPEDQSIPTSGGKRKGKVKAPSLSPTSGGRKIRKKMSPSQKEAELEGKRKDYLDPKTNKASPEGVKKYITKARQMRSGSNVPVDQETTDNIAKIAGKEYADKINQKYGGRRAGRRQSTATPPAFATRTGESGGPLPVSMRNRRVPKTSSLSTPVTTTPTFRDFQDKVKTVSLGKGMEIVNEPKTKTTKSKGELGGQTVDTVATQTFDKIKGGVTKGLLPPSQETQTQTQTGTKLLSPSSKPDLTKLLDPKKKKFPINPQSFRKEPTPEEKLDTGNQTDSGTGGTRPPRKITKTYGPGGPKKPFTPIKSAREFARKDPVAALGAYDLGKGVLGKIMKTRLPSLQARSGFRSARGGGGL